MTKPLKISENNAPLSCKQHDDNIDALLDRRNHTGKIPDCEEAFEETNLNDCITKLETIKDLRRDVNNLQSEYDVLNASIVPNGDIEASIANLDKKINDELIPVNSTLLTIATDLDLVYTDPITQRTRFYTVAELNAKITDGTDPRELTRKKLDELSDRLLSFIQQNESVISKNASDIANLINPTNGTFTLLKNYVNTSVKDAVDQVPLLDTEIDGVRVRAQNVEYQIGDPGLVNDKTINQNLIDLYGLIGSANGNNNNTSQSVNDLAALIGNKNSLDPSTTTVIGNVRKNSLDIDSVQQSSDDNGIIAREARDDLAALTTEVEKRHNFLYLERPSGTSHTVTVNGGPYIKDNGGRGFYPTTDITIPSTPDGYYLQLIDDSVTVTTDLPEEGILLGTVNVDSSGITGVYNSYNARTQGFAKPYKSPRFGGRSETSYVAAGTGGIISGLQYYKSFYVPGGTKVTVSKGAKIVVAKTFRVDGTIEVLPVTEGGQGMEKEVSRGFLGNEPGGGVSWHRRGYHWSVFPAGTAGRNGLAGATDRDFVITVPRGGDGGGGLIVQAGEKITINGTITANGENGHTGSIQSSSSKQGGVSGSGGGAGGCVVLQSATEIEIASSARIECNGGYGGVTKSNQNYAINGAGGGGGGWISLTAPSISRSNGADLESNGGIAGTNSFDNFSVINPAQGGAVGGAFGGKGGNGSSFDVSERGGQDNPIELIYEHPGI